MGDVVPLRDVFDRPPDLASIPCSDERLLEAVQWWLLGEPHGECARMVGVGDVEFYKVMRSRGWRKLAGILRDALAAAAHTSITRLVSKALGELETRLEEGDAIYNDKGVFVGYAPIKARDVAAIVGVLVDRQHAIEKRAMSASGAEDDEAAKELWAKLKRFAQAKELAP